MRQLSLSAVRKLGFAICLLLLLNLAGRSVHAQSAPAPDPAGIATGDKSNVTDAAEARSSCPNRRTSPRPTTPRRRKRTTSIKPPRRRSRWP